MVAAPGHPAAGRLRQLQLRPQELTCFRLPFPLILVVYTRLIDIQFAIGRNLQPHQSSRGVSESVF